MKAMDIKNQKLKHFVKHREEDAQCGKMILYFEEDKFKRLEVVSSDKIVVEAHLLEEKNVLMDELEIIKNNIDQNLQVMRVEMENIRLIKELRRYQECYEGGELEKILEQIVVLGDQLLKALEQKLMHEKDTNLMNQNESS